MDKHHADRTHPDSVQTTAPKPDGVGVGGVSGHQGPDPVGHRPDGADTPAVAATEKVAAALKVAVDVANVIKEVGGIPNGQLYALMMGHMSLMEYNALLMLMKNMRLIKEENHILLWIGDTDGSQTPR